MSAACPVSQCPSRQLPRSVHVLPKPSAALPASSLCLLSRRRPTSACFFVLICSSSTTFPKAVGCCASVQNNPNDSNKKHCASLLHNEMRSKKTLFSSYSGQDARQFGPLFVRPANNTSVIFEYCLSLTASPSSRPSIFCLVSGSLGCWSPSQLSLGPSRALHTK